MCTCIRAECVRLHLCVLVAVDYSKRGLPMHILCGVVTHGGRRLGETNVGVIFPVLVFRRGKNGAFVSKRSVGPWTRNVRVTGAAVFR